MANNNNNTVAKKNSEVLPVMNYQSVQQNLNQIAQICNQLSQNEQTNASRLQQMQQSEQSASQQLRQAAQLCSQVAQQMQQLTSTQLAGASQLGGGTQFGASTPFTGGSQYTGTSTAGMGAGQWSNIPINTTSAFGGYQSGRHYGFEASKELAGEQATGKAAFNTNKDLGQ